MIDQMRKDGTSNASSLTRRDMIRTGVALAAGAMVSGLWIPKAEAFALGLPSVRSISLYNTHTNETFTGVYRVGDKYLPPAMEKINHVLRDFRTGDVHEIAPQVIDIVFAVHKMSGKEGPVNIVSGYRSPKTNSMLRSASTGVAKNSMHLQGRAIDFRIPEFSTLRAREIAMSLKGGGVGYYKSSDFVHVDNGKVRHW